MSNVICSEPNCNRPTKKRGLCNACYKRKRGNGSLPVVRPIFTSLEDRFFAKVNKTEKCWLWTGCIRRGGYGWFRAEGRSKLAHRVSYEIHKGPIPDGLSLDHLCRVTSCVNPDHLEPVTRGENVLRGEGLSAQNARKTHCPKGHPYNAVNTEIQRDRKGRRGRRCRVCHRARVNAAQKLRRQVHRDSLKSP